MLSTLRSRFALAPAATLAVVSLRGCEIVSAWGVDRIGGVAPTPAEVARATTFEAGPAP